jgi:hypothetical protein
MIVWWRDGWRFVVSEFCEAADFIQFIRFLEANKIEHSCKKENIR